MADGRQITQAGLRVAANDLGTDLATVKAVLDVESSGSGFLKSGKPKILFEGHIFHRLTKGRWSSSHPTISYPRWTKKFYLGGEREWRRFSEAFALDPEAAMRAASWGLGQILGDNFKAAGFKTVGSFVDAMKRGEDQQLQAMIDFIQSNHLDDELQAHNWAGFAKGYNGAAYKRNNYDSRLQTAWRRHLKDEQLPMDQVADHQQEMIGEVEDEGDVEVDPTPAVSTPEAPPPSEVPVKIDAEGTVTSSPTIVVPPVATADQSGRKSFWGVILGGLATAATAVLSHIKEIIGYSKDSGYGTDDIIRWVLIITGVLTAIFLLRQLIMGLARLVSSTIFTLQSMKYHADPNSNNVVVGQPAPPPEAGKGGVL